MFLHYNDGQCYILSYREPDGAVTDVSEIILALECTTVEKLIASVDKDTLDLLCDGEHLQEIGATQSAVESVYNLINENL